MKALSAPLIGNAYFDGLVVCRAEATETAAERIYRGQMKLTAEFFHRKGAAKVAE